MGYIPQACQKYGKTNDVNLNADFSHLFNSIEIFQMSQRVVRVVFPNNNIRLLLPTQNAIVPRTATVTVTPGSITTISLLCRSFVKPHISFIAGPSTVTQFSLGSTSAQFVDPLSAHSSSDDVAIIRSEGTNNRTCEKGID